MDRGKWEGTLQIINEQNGKKQKVDLDIYSILNQKMRIDVTALLGLPVASMLLDSKSMRVLSFAEKTVYEGIPTPERLAKALKVPMDAQLLYAIVNGARPLGWDCQSILNSGVAVGLKCLGPKETALESMGSTKMDRKTILRAERKTLEFELTYKGLDFGLPEDQVFELRTPRNFKIQTIQ